VRYDQKHISSSCKVTVIPMKLGFPRNILENTEIKFNENPPSGIRVVPCGQTAGHYEDNIRGSKTSLKINLLIMACVITCGVL
jgi:hypothetical protein